MFNWPLASWYSGHDGIRTWLGLSPLNGTFKWKHVLTHANGQPAFVAHAPQADGVPRPHSLQVLTVAGGLVTHNVVFVDPAVLAMSFGGAAGT